MGEVLMQISGLDAGEKRSRLSIEVELPALPSCLECCCPHGDFWQARLDWWFLDSVARDSKAILAAFGKSPTPEHLNQHQRKNREDLEKVHLKFSSFYNLFSKVQHLFVGCGRETVRYVIERYRLDFLMCGYKRTLEQLEQLLWHQHLQKNYKSYYGICINPQKVTNVEFFKTRHSFTKRKLQKASIGGQCNCGSTRTFHF